MTDERPDAELGRAAADEKRSKRARPPGNVDWSEVLRGPEPHRPPDAAAESAGTTRTSADERPRPATSEATPDPGSRCPVCDHAYGPGEGVLALAWLPFTAAAVPPAPGAADRPPGRMIILGHHRCVLPRLLTLLAGFQPEARFVTAFRDLPDGPCAFPESPHDEP